MTTKIACVGNCQVLGLVVYIKELCRINQEQDKYIIKWCPYDDEIRNAVFGWQEDCKINDEQDGINFLKEADILIYQHIQQSTSRLFNTDIVMSYIKKECKLISMVSIVLSKDNFESDLSKLVKQDLKYNNTLQIGAIVQQNLKKFLMLSCCHPTSFFYLQIMKQLCPMIGLTYFENDTVYIDQPNFIGMSSYNGQYRWNETSCTYEDL